MHFPNISIVDIFSCDFLKMCELKIPIKLGFVMVCPGDFPGGSDGKASAYNVGDPGSIPWSGRSLGEGKPTPVFLPGKSHGRRSL